MKEIISIRYDDVTQVLTVLFTDGDRYQELGVKSLREAKTIVAIRFPSKPTDEPPKKTDRHLHLC